MPARVDMPQPFDLVGEDLRIGGVGHGFEGTLDWRVGEGHDERSGIISAGSLGAFRQFHETADLAGNAFTLNRLFVEVFETSAADGSEIDKVIVPVIYGPLIVPGFVGYREYTVVAGDTLSKIATSSTTSNNLPAGVSASKMIVYHRSRQESGSGGSCFGGDIGPIGESSGKYCY